MANALKKFTLDVIGSTIDLSDLGISSLAVGTYTDFQNQVSVDKIVHSEQLVQAIYAGNAIITDGWGNVYDAKASLAATGDALQGLAITRKLGELEDVGTSDAPTNGQALVWNSSTEKYEIANIATANITDFVDEVRAAFGGIDPGSTDYLSYDSVTGKLSVKQLLLVNVVTSADPSETDIATWVTNNYIGSPLPLQEGDVVILPYATGGVKGYINNGNATGTAADFVELSFPITEAFVRSSLSAGNGISYDNAGGVISALISPTGGLEFAGLDGDALAIKFATSVDGIKLPVLGYSAIAGGVVLRASGLHFTYDPLTDSLQIAADAITTTELADNAVATANIALNAVGEAQMNLVYGAVNALDASNLQVNPVYAWQSIATSPAPLSVEDVLTSLDAVVATIVAGGVTDIIGGAGLTAIESPAGVFTLDVGAGTAINVTADSIAVKISSTGALYVVSDGATGELAVRVDGSSLEVDVNDEGDYGIRVKAVGINDTHIDFGTGSNQVNAEDLPLTTHTWVNIDSPTDVQDALEKIDAIAGKCCFNWSAVDQATNVTNRHIGSPNTTNVTPFVVPYNATLERITLSSAASSTWTAEIWVNGSLLVDATLASGGSQYATSGALNISLTAGDRVSMYVNGTSVNKPGIFAFFKEA